MGQNKEQKMLSAVSCSELTSNSVNLSGFMNILHLQVVLRLNHSPPDSHVGSFIWRALMHVESLRRGKPMHQYPRII